MRRSSKASVIKVSLALSILEEPGKVVHLSGNSVAFLHHCNKVSMDMV